jgi:hypothetical protein
MAPNTTPASRAQRSAAAKRGQARRKRSATATRRAATTSRSSSNGTTAAARASRSAAGKRGTATRRRQAARRRTTVATRSARTAATQRVSAEAKQAESILTQVTGVAESALLVPVGAALEVRDRVRGAIQPWTTRTTAERELGRVRRDVRRFERRGTVARNRVVRELRKRRNRVVRELRKRRGQALRVARVRRTGAQRTIKQNGRRTQVRADRLRSQVEKTVGPQVNRVQKELQEQTKQARDRVQQFV